MAQANGAKSPLSASSPIAVAIATSGGVGFIPLAPGTCGAIVGIILFVPLSAFGLPTYLVALAGLSVLGVWASGRAEQHFDNPDDGRIVIDEVVGQMIALTPLVAWGTGAAGLTEMWSGQFIFLLVTGFVAFRWLDIYKPGVIRWAERNLSGGTGVMADDWLAGLFAAVFLAMVTAGVLSFAAQAGAQ